MASNQFMMGTRVSFYDFMSTAFTIYTSSNMQQKLPSEGAVSSAYSSVELV